MEQQPRLFDFGVNAALMVDRQLFQRGRVGELGLIGFLRTIVTGKMKMFPNGVLRKTGSNKTISHGRLYVLGTLGKLVRYGGWLPGLLSELNSAEINGFTMTIYPLPCFLSFRATAKPQDSNTHD